MTKLKQKLRGSTTSHEPVKPPQPELPQDPAQQQPPGPPQRKFSTAELAAADELRTRQRRGLLRRPTLRGEPPPERFLTWGDLFARGLINSKTQARRLWMRGAFPKPVHLSQRVIAFRESEIDAWAASRTTGWKEPRNSAA